MCELSVGCATIPGMWCWVTHESKPSQLRGALGPASRFLYRLPVLPSPSDGLWCESICEMKPFFTALVLVRVLSQSQKPKQDSPIQLIIWIKVLGCLISPQRPLLYHLFTAFCQYRVVCSNFFVIILNYNNLIGNNLYVQGSASFRTFYQIVKLIK